MAAGGSTTVVLIAMGANFGIACAKFAAAAWTGSSAMFSEAIHSIVDTTNQVLLLVGIKRANRKADANHPFGYSKELYFWSFIVAILLFSLGAGVSLYEGVEKYFHPHPIEHADIIYIVLGLAIGMEGFSTYKALAEFRKRYAGARFMSALQKSKDPALFAIVLEDIAAMLGLFTALIGVLIADKLGYQEADGIASIVIGLILASVAIFMAIEIKKLIIGEAADPDVQRGLFDIITAESHGAGPVLAINEIKTMHLGPTDILVAASIDFKDKVCAEEIEATTHRLEQTIKERYPAVRRLFIEVQSTQSHNHAIAHDGHATKTSHGDTAPAPTKPSAEPAKTPTNEPKPAAPASTTAPKPKPKAEARGEKHPELSELPSNRKGRKGRRKARKQSKKKN